MQSFTFACFGPLLLTAQLTAQGRVWVVDSQNRAGTDFTDLGLAVRTAADRDLLQVRDGVYAGPLIDKGLTIQCLPGAVLDPAGQPLRVRGVPAHRQVAIVGLTITGANLGAVVLENNAGRVLLDRMTMSTGIPPAVTITDCAQVQMTRCAAVGSSVYAAQAGAGVLATRSTLALSQCTVRGGDSIEISSKLFLGSSAIELSQCRLVLGGGSLDGGAGWPRGLTSPDFPAVVARDSHLTFAGDATTAVRAGAARIGVAPAIMLLQGSELTYDPNIMLRSNAAGVPEIGGTGRAQAASVPWLRTTGVAPGRTVQATASCTSGDLVAFFVSPSAHPQHLPIGSLWLDPAQMLSIGGGFIGRPSYLANSTHIPNDPSLAFVAWTMQCVGIGQAGSPRLSNPVGFALMD